MAEWKRNVDFIDRAYACRGPKLISGFSRPLFHNVQGLFFGRKFNKRAYGGMIRHSEGAMLRHWAAQLPRDAVVVEIGCYGGLSTSYLASGCGPRGGHVYAIDPFDTQLEREAAEGDGLVALEGKPSRERVRERLARAGLADCVTLLTGFAEQVVTTWDRPIDMLWIDGNHDRAWEDYQDWAGHLKGGSRLALHDAHPKLGYPQVAEAARQIFSDERWTRLEHVKSIMTGVLRA